jgi:type II secretory pathway pseudopilin PulG
MNMKWNIRRHSRAHSNAFTLAEAVVAMAVVSLLFVSLFAGIGYAYKQAQLIREDARATQIINEKIDKLHLLNWDDLNDKNVTPDKFYCAFNPEDVDLGDEGVTNLKGSGKYKQDQLIYEGKIDINKGPTDSVYGTNMVTVKVKLNWTSSTGLARERSVTTFLAKFGMQAYAL